MTITSLLPLKTKSLFGFKFTKPVKIENQKENNQNLENQKDTPKEIRRGINMTDEQKDTAQKIKDDILKLYKEGYSIRMIANHYNDLYSIRNSQGHIMKEAISRETVRKILNHQEVSLKVIIGIVNSMDFNA